MRKPGITKEPTKAAKPSITPFSTPRDRFQSVQTNIEAHQNLIDSEAFERGSDAAMLEFCSVLSGSVANAESALAAGHQLKGAFAYLRKLKTLAEASKVEAKQGNPDVLQPTEPYRRP